jgi:hypothetical protein
MRKAAGAAIHRLRQLKQSIKRPASPSPNRPRNRTMISAGPSSVRQQMGDPPRRKNGQNEPHPRAHSLTLFVPVPIGVPSRLRLLARIRQGRRRFGR